MEVEWVFFIGYGVVYGVVCEGEIKVIEIIWIIVFGKELEEYMYGFYIGLFE